MSGPPAEMTIETTSSAATQQAQSHAPAARALAALLCGLLAAGPAAPALAAPAKKPRPPVAVLAVPLVTLPGAPVGAAEKLWAQVVTEVKTRQEIALIEASEKGSDLALSANRGAAEADKAAADARSQFVRAQELAKKGKAAQAATGYLKAITLLLSKPLTVDEPGGVLLTEATAQMAVARMISGNDEGGDEALADLVRRAPDKAPTGADYPPAFLRAYDAARQRVLSGPRGILRVLAPTEAGVPARVLLDGHHLGAAPLQLSDVPSGVHVVRVDRPGEA